MKQNHYILFPSLTYFGFKSLANMNERKVSFQSITGVPYIFIYVFNTATISGTLQFIQEFQNSRSADNGINTFELSPSAIICWFSTSINTKRLERLSTALIIPVFFLLALTDSSISYSFQLLWFLIVLGVAKFSPRTLYPPKSNFTETAF